jgi:hypothetical protein
MAEDQNPWIGKFSEMKTKDSTADQQEAPSSIQTTTVSIPSKQQSIYLSDLEEIVGNASSTFLCANKELLMDSSIDRAHALWEAKTCGNPEDMRIDSYKYPIFIQAYILDDNVSILQLAKAFKKGDKTIRRHAKEITRGWKNMTDTMQDRTLFNSDCLIIEYLNATEKILALLDQQTVVMGSFNILKKTINATIYEKNRTKADLFLKNYFLSSPMFQDFLNINEGGFNDTVEVETSTDSNSVESKDHNQANPDTVRKRTTYYLIEDDKLVYYYVEDGDDLVDAASGNKKDQKKLPSEQSQTNTVNKDAIDADAVNTNQANINPE